MLICRLWKTPAVLAEVRISVGVEGEDIDGPLVDERSLIKPNSDVPADGKYTFNLKKHDEYEGLFKEDDSGKTCKPFRVSHRRK